MSTKIYNGYRMPMMEIGELSLFFGELRKKALESQKEIIKKHWSEDDFKKNWMELSRLSDEVNRTGKRNPLIDFEFNISFFPVGDWLLMIAFTE